MGIAADAPVQPAEFAPRQDSAPACPDCGSHAVATFCAHCGERQPSHADYTARHIAGEVLSEFVSVDGRLWRSIVALLSKPGFLTAEYFAGRRNRYMRPFGLFVMLNVAFFFVQPYTGLLNYRLEMYTASPARAAKAETVRREKGLAPIEFRRAFRDELANQKKSLLLFGIPVFALALQLLYARTERTYVEHLVFSVHAYAYFVFYLTAIGTLWFLMLRELSVLLPQASGFWRFMGREAGVDTMLLIGLLPYLTVALRRFYGSPMITSAVRSVALFGAYGFLLVTFRDVLFHTTLLFL